MSNVFYLIEGGSLVEGPYPFERHILADCTFRVNTVS